MTKGEVLDTSSSSRSASSLRAPAYAQDPLLRQLTAKASSSNHEFLEVDR